MDTLTNIEQQIAEVESKLNSDPGNLWLLRYAWQLEQKRIEAGGEADEADEAVAVDPVSPPKVQGIEGYSMVPMPMVLPPEWAQLGDPDEGLMISNARSYGCHQLFNVEEVGQLWANHSEKVAEHYGCSARIIKYAGRRMLGNWYLLPTGHFQNFHDTDPDYLFTPPVAEYNEAEQELWRKMFVKYHFSGAALLMGGHGKYASHLQYSTIRYEDKPILKHFIPTVANHPWWILPGLAAHFNTGQHKNSAFATALNLLFNMDRGIREKDEFYEDWQDYAPKGMGLREYSHTFEPTATAARPDFKPGLEFNP